mmetsp:Transcript_72838/g.176083  ORF Transcript_72838/g.176083 Transcript_72838/m.176083 type:complete len:106 (+) Transcript_72838:10-327(+)
MLCRDKNRTYGSMRPPLLFKTAQAVEANSDRKCARLFTQTQDNMGLCCTRWTLHKAIPVTLPLILADSQQCNCLQKRIHGSDEKLSGAPFVDSHTASPPILCRQL